MRFMISPRPSHDGKYEGYTSSSSFKGKALKRNVNTITEGITKEKKKDYVKYLIPKEAKVNKAAWNESFQCDIWELLQNHQVQGKR